MADNRQLEDWQKQALLTEYQVCQTEAAGAVDWTWQSGVIFFVTTLALLGAMVSGVIGTGFTAYRLILIIGSGAFSIVLLWTWDRYLLRQSFIRRVMFYRMEMIERQLNLRKNLYVQFLDRTLEDNPLAEEERRELRIRFERDAGRTPQGLTLVRRIIRVTILSWGLFILWEIIVFVSPDFRTWLLMILD